MKHFFAQIFILVAFTASAQHDSTESIAESEMQAATSFAALAVNPNTLNYDVLYHKLEFQVDPADYYIEGVVTTTFAAVQNMSTVTFDLNNQLDVTEVVQDGNLLSFSQNDNDELVIVLPSVLPAGSQATVEIRYEGLPGFWEQAFTTTTHGGVPVLYTLSEPYGARDWWPCKQDLNDKVDSIDVYITAPSEYVSVSNGVEQSQQESGGLTTTHFHHSYPIPAYLIAIAVTNYQVYTQTAGLFTPFPIVNYIYPEDYSVAVSQLQVTVPIMDLFESTFEPYPFAAEKYGHAQFNFGGGMEHTTVSFMGGFGRNLIAHELAHQWFGNKVTCGSWQDIWLNEGFAEYLSGMVVEHLDGEGAFINWKASKIENIISQPGGAVYLTEEETNSVNRIFSSRLSYNKGAMVVHMLRFKLGDEAFFQGVKNYLADPSLAYDYAVTEDLKQHLEVASGQDLDEFFSDWIYNQGYPSYNILVQNWGAGQARFVITQSQSHPSVEYFEMPVPVRVFGSGGQQADLVLQNTTNNQELIVPVPFEVSGLEVNPKRDLITGSNISLLSSGEYSFADTVSMIPNPSGGMIAVILPTDAALQSVVIRNALGQIVRHSEDSQIDVTDLASGIHFAAITTSRGVVVKKFIRQ